MPASKALIERLELKRADALGPEPDRVTSIPLADVPTATEKARRDAPALVVCAAALPLRASSNPRR